MKITPFCPLVDRRKRVQQRAEDLAWERWTVWFGDLHPEDQESVLREARGEIEDSHLTLSK